MFHICSNQPSGNNSQRRRYTLEPNHTHYIFFDDGTYDSVDTTGFVSKLARQISRGALRRSEFLVEQGTLVLVEYIGTNSVDIINQSTSEDYLTDIRYRPHVFISESELVKISTTESDRLIFRVRPVQYQF